MQQAIKRSFLFGFLFFLMYVPFALAKSSSVETMGLRGLTTSAGVFAGSEISAAPAAAIYDSLDLDQLGLGRPAFENAIAGWEKLANQGKLQKTSVLAIADFSQSSNQKRLYVLDMKNYRLLFNTLVAHGKNSGKEYATRFSNRVSSNQSSPGFYVTGNTYYGGNGYSLRLEGVEKGINDKAQQRAIVVHGANYVNESFTSSLGYIGRSQGCPAVPQKLAKPIINTMKGGTCLYIYTPDQQYYSRSTILNSNEG